MNIIEAMLRGITGQRIKRESKNEWMIVTSKGTEIRWASNRQKAVIIINDILAEDWMCEEDVIVISRNQIEEAFKLLKIEPEGKKEFLKHLGFKWGIEEEKIKVKKEIKEEIEEIKEIKVDESNINDDKTEAKKDIEQFMAPAVQRAKENLTYVS